ncbi:MAG TPA: type IV pilus secretin PilQ [Nevskiaceae bacterium]
MSNPIRMLRSPGRRRWTAALVLVAGLGLNASFTGAVRAADSPVRTLESVDVSRVSGERVLVRLHLSGPAPQEPGSFTVREPARVAIDLPHTGLGHGNYYQTFDVGVLRAYAAVATEDRTRVVFDLSHMVPYSIRAEGDDVMVDLGSAEAVSTMPAAAPAAAPTVASRLAGVHTISKIDFRRGEGGEGRVIVDLDDPNTQVDVQQEGGKIVARFAHTTAPDDLIKRLDVLDFATPVKYIDTRRDRGGIDVIVTPVSDSNFQQLSFQTDNQFVIALQPLTQQQQEARQREHPQYTGKKITLDFQKVDIRALLQIIADVAGVNMVVSDAVKGDIAIRLDDVPWDQALAIILQSKGLGQRHVGNVIFVAPLQELAERRKVELESQRQTVELAPLHSELMQVNYAKAADIAKLLKSDKNSFLGERGRVTVDERTNTLLVLDTLDKLADIRNLIQRLDVPVRQVQIESRIVLANSNFDRQIGTQFGITAIGSMGSNNLLTTSGSATAADAIANAGGPRDSSRFASTGLLDRYNVNMVPNAATPGSLAVALLGKHFLVDLELQALQAEGMGEVVSSPRVITANAKEASIEQGVEIPYQESASSGATSVTFKKAVMSLTVTPQITPDGRIIMDLAVRRDNVGDIVPTGQGGSVPSIDTRRVTTQVLVNDGQTVVLGGIYEDTKNTNTSKVPLLGDLPLLGFLFKMQGITNNRTELLIFTTPKIINKALTLNPDD